jgi:glycosyltransferase involved in cell wall biosynthesis
MNNSGNILYLSYDGLTDPLGQSQILPYLQGLSTAGFSITIISFEKSSRYRSRRQAVEDLVQASNLRWFPMEYHKYPPIFSTLYDVAKLYNKSVSLHRENDFQIVHCRSYITALVGLKLKKSHRLKFIFDMRGFWADERVDGGLWNLKNPLYKKIYKFFKRKELEFLSEADHVVSLTHSAKKEILTWRVSTPISVIPCCVDLTHFNRTKIDIKEQTLLRRTLGIGEKDFVLLYLGSLGTWYMVKEMLDFFSVLKEQCPNAKLLLVTPDKWTTDTNGFSKDIRLVSAERNEVPLYLSLATASMFFIKPAFSKKASSATKMGELLAMNIPVITNRGWGDAEAVLSKTKLGILLSDFEDTDYRYAIQQVLKISRSEAADSLSDEFSLSNGVISYKNIYTELTNTKATF